MRTLIQVMLLCHHFGTTPPPSPCIPSLFMILPRPLHAHVKSLVSFPFRPPHCAFVLHLRCLLPLSLPLPFICKSRPYALLTLPCHLATCTELTLSLLTSSSLSWRLNTHISSSSVRPLIRDCCHSLTSITDEPTNNLDIQSIDTLSRVAS